MYIEIFDNIEFYPLDPWIIDLRFSKVQFSKFLMIDISSSYPLLTNIFICISS